MQRRLPFTLHRASVHMLNACTMIVHVRVKSLPDQLTFFAMSPSNEDSCFQAQ